MDADVMQPGQKRDAAVAAAKDALERASAAQARISGRKADGGTP